MKMFRALAVAAFAAFLPAAAFGQAFNIPGNSNLQGHLISGCVAPPAIVGGTIAAGSCDTDGEFTATAASGTITFASPFTTKPSCSLVDQSATPIAVWANTPTVLTLTTLTSGHVYTWHCAAKVGG